MAELLSGLDELIGQVQTAVAALAEQPTSLGFDADVALAVVPLLVAAEQRVRAATLAAIGAVDLAGAHGRVGARTTADWLHSALALDRPAASRLARVAAELRQLPCAAAALAAGEVDLDRVARITHATARARRVLSPVGGRDSVTAQIAAGEQLLTRAAAGRPAEAPTGFVADPETGEQLPVVDEDAVDPETGEVTTRTRAPHEGLAALTPSALARVADCWLELVLPGESERRDREQAARRQVFLSQTLHGTWDLKGTLTPEAGAIVAAALEAGMLRPETDTPVDAPTRRHDALLSLAEHFLATSVQARGSVRGVRPQALLTIDVRDLLADSTHVDPHTGQRHHAFSDWVPSCTCQLPPSLGGTRPWVDGRPATCRCETRRDPVADPVSLERLLRRARPVLRAPDGTTSPISTRAARRYARNSDLRRVLLAKGVPLDLGRSVRLATPDQRLALHLRDGYRCRFGPCTAPPAWLVAHHRTYWSLGGTTDLGELISLCDHHHDRIHHERWVIEGDPDESVVFVSADGRYRVHAPPVGPAPF